MKLLNFIQENDKKDRETFTAILNLYLGLRIGKKDMTVQGLKKEIKDLTKENA
jgi:hypothetical protein